MYAYIYMCVYMLHAIFTHAHFLHLCINYSIYMYLPICMYILYGCRCSLIRYYVYIEDQNMYIYILYMIYIYMYSYIVPFMYGHVVHVCMHYIYIYTSPLLTLPCKEKKHKYTYVSYT